MLFAKLTRVTPGRPEAQLAQVCITPRISARGPLKQRFDVHIVDCGDGDTDRRTEEHAHIDQWDSSRPPIDLLMTALLIGHAQRENTARGIDTIVMPGSMAAIMLRAVEHAIEDGTLDLTDDQLLAVEQLRRDVAPPVAFH